MTAARRVAKAAVNFILVVVVVVVVILLREVIIRVSSRLMDAE